MSKNLERVKLQRLSICPCGYSVLDDSIVVGAEYDIDRRTLRGGFVYKCGQCGRVQADVQCVTASQRLRPDRPAAPLPYGLFSLAV